VTKGAGEYSVFVQSNHLAEGRMRRGAVAALISFGGDEADLLTDLSLQLRFPPARSVAQSAAD